ncbi:MAG: vitamin K epoxide reductase family protein [Longimicrobiales bacterium]
MTEEGASPPANRMAMAMLALVGLLISSYLLLYKVAVIGSIACGSGSCERVQSSPWATFLFLPVPAWGVGGYLFILVLALLGLQPRFAGNRILTHALLWSSGFAFGFSAYLTAVEAFLIQAWCRWCVASAIVATLVFLAALFEVPALMRKRSETVPFS